MSDGFKLNLPFKQVSKGKARFDFLATPYYDKSEEVREERYQKAMALVAGLIGEGRRVFSPILYGHAMAKHHNLPLTADEWESFNRAFLQSCETVIVAKLPGWEESKGVQREIELARKFRKDIEYLDPAIYDL